MADFAPSLPCVVLELNRPEDLLDRYYPNGKMGGLTIDGASPAALGQLCELRVHFAQPRRQFIMKVQLSWARHRGSRGLKESYGVDFLAEQGADRLLSLAHGDPSPFRSEDRLSSEWPVKLVHEGETRRECLADISSRGAFVRTASPLPHGAEVELHLRTPRALTALHLKGHVVWVRHTGAAGMGIEFEPPDPKQLLKLERLLSKLAW